MLNVILCLCLCVCVMNPNQHFWICTAWVFPWRVLDRQHSGQPQWCPHIATCLRRVQTLWGQRIESCLVNGAPLCRTVTSSKLSFFSSTAPVGGLLIKGKKAADKWRPTEPQHITGRKTSVLQSNSVIITVHVRLIPSVSPLVLPGVIFMCKLEEASFSVCAIQ